MINKIGSRLLIIHRVTTLLPADSSPELGPSVFEPVFHVQFCQSEHFGHFLALGLGTEEMLGEYFFQYGDLLEVVVSSTSCLLLR